MADASSCSKSIDAMKWSLASGAILTHPGLGVSCGSVMKFLLSLLTAAVFLLVPVAAYADDVAGSVGLHITEAAVAPTEGMLSRDVVVAIHELQADRGAVLLDSAGRGAVSSQAGDVLVAVNAGPRVHLYCDISARRSLAGGFIPCFEDQNGDGRFETRYLGSTRVNIPSTFLMLAAPDTIEPAAFREAEAHERPVVRVGFEPCARGRQPTFRLVISTEVSRWSGGGRCRSAEQTLQNIGIGFATLNTESGVSYRVTQTLPAGGEVLLFPHF